METFWQGGDCITALEKNLDKTLGFMVTGQLHMEQRDTVHGAGAAGAGAQQRETGGQSIRCKNLLHHRKFRHCRGAKVIILI